MSIGTKRKLTCDEQSINAEQIFSMAFFCDGTGKAYLRINPNWIDKDKLAKSKEYDRRLIDGAMIKSTVIPEPIKPEPVRLGFVRRLWNWIVSLLKRIFHCKNN